MATIKLKLNNNELEKISLYENTKNISLTQIMNLLLEEFNKSKNLRKKIINSFDNTILERKSQKTTV